ncbi:MAG: endo-1,4-beta-xylanase [Janthinobacterium lividum]
MKKPQRIVLALVAALGSHFTLSAQNAPVLVEAETGTSTNPTTPLAGSTTGDWQVATKAAAGNVPAATYITTLSTAGGTSPGTAARVLTYSVTFPAAGVYDLYARVWVGTTNGGADDDSYFVPNGFGTKGVATGGDWINCNNLNTRGYNASNGLAVDGEGSAGTSQWKWLNMSKFTNTGTGVPYTVPAGSLTQTLQIGAREDGFLIDKFVFGDHSLYFTATQLDNGSQGTTTAPVAFVPAYAPLAAGKPKYLGSAYSTAQSGYFTDYWNAVTPENGGKWSSVEGTRGTFNFVDLDSAYNRSVKSGGPFRLHTLIWGSQQPTWIKSLSQTDQLAEIKIWFNALAVHFAGKKIDFIDVVNEPIHTPPTGFITTGNTGAADPAGGGYIDALGGTGTTGYDWIVTSFQLARQYFPNAKLMLNEYSVENDGNSAKKYYDMAMLLKTQPGGSLIDGIGIQGHAFSLNTTSTATIQANMATLASTNLPLYITEFDLDAATDAAQVTTYQRVFPLFWENPAVRGITLWGFRVGHWRTAQGDNLINSDNTERPAMVWLRNYVASAYTGPMWTGNTSGDVSVATNWITNTNKPANSVVSSASTYTLPTAADDFYFPGYAANQPTVTSALTARSITLGATTTPGTSTVLSPVLTTNAVLTLTGNLTNNGGSVAGTGTVAMSGTATQTIGGTTATTFPNLTVGTATVSLAAPAKVRQMLTLNGNLTTNSNAFTLLSDATGTAMVVNASGTVVGNATMQRYITPSYNGTSYRQYSSPMGGSVVSDLATANFSPTVNSLYNTAPNPYAVTPFPTVFDYNTSRLASTNATTADFNFGWESPAALNSALAPGQGYTVNIPSTETVSLTGTLNNGAMSMTNLTRGTQTDAGWQLLGNPYPAPLNWDAVTTSGLDATLYVSQATGPYAGRYSSYVPTTGVSTNGGTNMLAAMQGFFVRTTSASTAGSLSFANAARATTYVNPTFQRTTTGTDPLVRLDLRDATGAADEMIVYFPSAITATTGFDAAADAYKIAGGTSVLASEVGATLLSINALPTLGNTDVLVPLRVQATQAGTYTLRATELLNLPAGIRAYLRDAQTNTLFDLSQPTGYTLSLNPSAATGRFTLVLSTSKALGTASAAISQQVALYPNPSHGGSLALRLPAALAQQAVEVSVLNALGQQVARQTLAAGAQPVHTLALPSLAPGIYTVRLQTVAGTISKRLTID